MTERLTASVHGPTSGQRSLHWRQNFSVRFRRRQRIDRFRRILKRGAIGNGEGDGFACFHVKVADGSQILTTELGIAAQDKPVWAGDRANPAVVKARDPRDGRSVLEPRDELSAEVHFACLTDNDPDEPAPVRGRHEVDDGRLARLGFEFGFQDEGARTIASSHR